MKNFRYCRSVHFVSILRLLFYTALLHGCNKHDDSPGPVDYSDYTFEAPSVTGNTYYIDPVNGSSDGDGSLSHPWRTLQEVVEGNLICYYSENEEAAGGYEIVNEGAPVKGGDRLLLRTGYHGYFKRNVFIFFDWLTIEGGAGEEALLSQFRLEGSFAKIYLNNVTIAKDSYQGEDNYWEADAINRNSDACVYLRADDFWGDAGEIKLRDLNLMTTENTAGWTAEEWVEKAAGGINVRDVPGVEIIDCRLLNVSMGISFSDDSEDGVAVGNTIRNYSVDGVRLISNNLYFAYNTITDCYKVDDNHDDAIQSYTVGAEGVGTGILRNVVIWGNLIIGTTDFDNPLAGSPQGIGCFDGFFDNWIVENNVVIVDHYHGISFYGMHNGTIAHNTVIDQVPGNDISPWIMVHDHKNGIPSANCLVVNNIAHRTVSAGNQITTEANFVLRENDIEDLTQVFTDPDEFDLHLKGSVVNQEYIIDQGVYKEELESCHHDKEGNERDEFPDLGAYEYIP